MTRSNFLAASGRPPNPVAAPIGVARLGRRGSPLPRTVRGLGGATLPIGLLVAWQATTSLGLFTIVQLPSPALVLSAAVELLARGELGTYVGVSAQRVLLGFSAGASLGLLLGAITGLSRRWNTFLGTTLTAARAVPSLAWVPLLVLWLKIGESSKVTLIAIGAFFPVYTTMSAALRHVDRQLVEAARAFGLRGVNLFTAVQLPAALPSVISGLRLALAQSWMFLVAAELIASSSGLGFLLMDSQNNGRVDRILLAIILLAVLGKATDALIGLFEKWASRRWA
jgi:sulfonate transport system permease protein